MSLSPEHHSFAGGVRSCVAKFERLPLRLESSLRRKVLPTDFRELEQSQNELVTYPPEAKALAGLCTADGLNVMQEGKEVSHGCPMTLLSCNLSNLHFDLHSTQLSVCLRSMWDPCTSLRDQVVAHLCPSLLISVSSR